MHFFSSFLLVCMLLCLKSLLWMCLLYSVTHKVGTEVIRQWPLACFTDGNAKRQHLPRQCMAYSTYQFLWIKCLLRFAENTLHGLLPVALLLVVSPREFRALIKVLDPCIVLVGFSVCIHC